MALTDSMTQQMLIDECIMTGDTRIYDTATRLMPYWWEFYSDKRQELRYWYVRRSLLMYLCGKARVFIDTQSGPDKVSASQVFAQTQKLLDMTQKECIRLDPASGAPSLKVLKVRTKLPDILEEELQLLERDLTPLFNPLIPVLLGDETGGIVSPDGALF